MNEDDRRRQEQSQSKQLVNKLRRLQGEASRHGVDLTPTFVGMIREAEQEIAEKRGS